MAQKAQKDNILGNPRDHKHHRDDLPRQPICPGE